MIIKIIKNLPQNSISRMAGKAMSSKLSRYFIRPYAKIYKIDTEEAEKKIEEYLTLQEFFTRKVKEKTRPINQEEKSVISPSDGVITQFGEIKEGKIIQAKGIDYSLEEFLHEDKEKMETFKDGYFLTIYLSPKNYHRVHAPLDGTLDKSSYIPGKLFPVNELAVKNVKQLYTKNERMITYLKTDAGNIAIAKIGAFIVGSVVVSYGDIRTNEKNAAYKSIIPDENHTFEKGQEVGYFRFGSTVVLLFEKNIFEISRNIKPGVSIKMGEKIGEYKSNVH